MTFAAGVLGADDADATDRRGCDGIPATTVATEVAA